MNYNLLEEAFKTLDKDTFCKIAGYIFENNTKISFKFSESPFYIVAEKPFKYSLYINIITENYGRRFSFNETYMFYFEIENNNSYYLGTSKSDTINIEKPLTIKNDQLKNEEGFGYKNMLAICLSDFKSELQLSMNEFNGNVKNYFIDFFEDKIRLKIKE